MMIAGLNLPIVEIIIIFQLGIRIFLIIVYFEERKKHKELLDELLGKKKKERK